MSKPTHPLATALRERANDQGTASDRRLMLEAAEALDYLYRQAYFFIPKPKWWRW